MLDWIRFACCAVFMITGVLVMLIAAIGNLRFRHVLPRMHAAAIGDSIGKLCLFAGLMIYDWGETMAEVKLLFILLFFWVSGPVTTHMMCRFQVRLERKRQKGEDV